MYILCSDQLRVISLWITLVFYHFIMCCSEGVEVLFDSQPAPLPPSHQLSLHLSWALLTPVYDLLE
jgi:hypothetical protein